MSKKFWEYSNLNGYPIFNEVAYPYCPSGEDDPNVFLIYAINEVDARIAANNHIFDGKPLERFFGNFNGKNYHGEIKCVM